MLHLETHHSSYNKATQQIPGLNSPQNFLFSANAYMRTSSVMLYHQHFLMRKLYVTPQKRGNKYLLIQEQISLQSSVQA